MDKMAESDIEEYDPARIEQKVQEMWDRIDLTMRIKNKRGVGTNDYIVHSPHLLQEHIDLKDIYNKLIYDVWTRYKYMNNYNLRNYFGYDSFSLSIEQKSLNEMGVNSTSALSKEEWEEFIDLCQQKSLKDKNDLEEEFRKIGIFYDPKKFFSTYASAFIDSIWWTIEKLYEQNLIRKEKKLMDWCVDCNSPLPDIESVRKKKTITSFLIKIPVKKGRNRQLLVQFSHPWELMGNVAMAVYPNEEYAIVQYRTEWGANKSLVLNSRVKEIMDMLGVDDHRVINTVKGDKLKGMEYINPIAERVPILEKRRGIRTNTIIASEDIPDTVTGVFPVSPGVNQASWKIAEEYGVEIHSPFEKDGSIKESGEYGAFSGLTKDDVNSEILQFLKEKDMIVARTHDTREAEFCVHCDSEVVNEIGEEWFLKVKPLEEEMMNLFENIERYPEWMGTSEEYNWMIDAEDFFITRRDGWGLPFPMWRCECGNVFLAVSIDELAERGGFKPNVKNMLYNMRDLKIECSKCGEMMRWEGKMINSLMISAVSPWAQLGYPKDEKLLQNWWPGSILFGSIEDSKGLFFSNLSISSVMFKKPPVESYVGHGRVSRTTGDVESLYNLSDQDSLRMAMVSERPIWEDVDITPDMFKRHNRVLRVMHNLHNFLVAEMPRADFNPEEVTLEFLKSYLKTEDNWLLSKTESINRAVKEAYEKHRWDTAVSIIERFILNDIAQWYISIAKERLEQQTQRETLAVLKVLHRAVIAMAKLLAPIAPYITDEIYQNIQGEARSVHLSDWPVTNTFLIDKYLENEMEEVKSLVEKITQAKIENDMPEKWPLKKVVVDAENVRALELFSKYGSIIKNKAKVMHLEKVGPHQEWNEMILKVHPNRNAIGKAYRQWVGKIELMLEKRPPKEIKKGVEKGTYQLGIEGHLVDIEPNMVTFEREMPVGFIDKKFEWGHLYIEMELDPQIWFKQMSHEIILRIKSMRKELELEKEDELELYIDAEEEIKTSVDKYSDLIKREVNARNLYLGSERVQEAQFLYEWEINGQPVDIGIIPLYKNRLIDIYQSIPGMSKELAAKLYENGYTSLELIEDAPVSEISSLDGFKRSLARRIVQVVKKRKEEYEARLDGRAQEADEISKKKREMKELSRLMQSVEGIGPARSEEIYNYGFKSYEDILSAELEEFTNIGHVTIAHAKELKRVVENAYSEELKGSESKEPEEHEEEEQETPAESEEPEELEEPEEIEEPDIEDMIVTVDEEEEQETETPAELPEGVSKSTTYLLIDKPEDDNFQLFKDVLQSGMDGLLVTRQYPDKVKDTYSLQDVDMIWLSNVDRENAVRPKNLEKFSLNIEQFLARKGGVILLNGMEYLITNNDFRTVLHLIQSLKDQVAINESILLIPVHKKTIDKRHIDLLESEVDEILE